MKRIDKLLLTSFISPFIVTFAIAMFVLLMQVLWVYLDDLAGKGLGFFLVMELLAYKCVGLVPMALPLAILISSVMVMGSLAEHYELSSIKSAGVSLLRTMVPIIIIGMGTTALSWYCSNHLIPAANLKFGSRMFDISQKKATLNLEEGIFNDDFTNYAIRIGKKDRDDRTIHDVLIYDHRDANGGELSEIIAETGEMFASPSGDYFVMNLENGNQYMESRPNNTKEKSGGFPFIRTSFQSWTKVFDLSEFKLARTPEDLFKMNKSMMTSAQLAQAADSISQNVLRRRKDLANHVANYITPMPRDSTFWEENSEADKKLAEKYEDTQVKSDSTKNNIRRDSSSSVTTTDSLAKVAMTKSPRDYAVTPAPKKPKVVQSEEYKRKRAERKKKVEEAKARRLANVNSPFKDVPDKIDDFGAFVDGMPSHIRNRTYTKARSFVRSITSQAESAQRSLDRMLENRVKYIYEQHMKYSMAVVCIIFVFIGAPMGAIVRKGGFGYPILVSIAFFISFIIMTIFCRKIAETHTLPAELAAWLPCIVLFPVGVFLTIKAMNDSKVVNLEGLMAILRIIRSVVRV